MNNLDKNNIEQLLSIVNQQLREGSSISTIEHELNFGKDTLRRKLNRAGYKFSKEKKQFILDKYLFEKHKLSLKDNTEPIEKSNDNTSETQSELKVKSIEKESSSDKINFSLQLTEEQFKILLEIIEERQQKSNCKIKYKRDKNNVISRSFRCYKDILNDFSKLCKKKNLNQRDALADALILFINENK